MRLPESWCCARKHVFERCSVTQSRWPKSASSFITLCARIRICRSIPSSHRRLFDLSRWHRTAFLCITIAIYNDAPHETQNSTRYWYLRCTPAGRLFGFRQNIHHPSATNSIPPTNNQLSINPNRNIKPNKSSWQQPPRNHKQAPRHYHEGRCPISRHQRSRCTRSQSPMRCRSRHTSTCSRSS